jgi:hypothetical protein
MYKALNPGLYEEARRKGMTFSDFLSHETVDGDGRDGMDAYQRLLQEAEIITRTHPQGHYKSSRVEAFAKDVSSRTLFPEWVRRTVAGVSFRESKAAQNGAGEKFIFLSDDVTAGSVLRPFADDLMMRMSDRTEPAIPLTEVVAATRFVDGNKARSWYLNRDASQARRKRVTEAAEIPPAKLTTKQHDIDLYKYGIRLDVSYETARRLALDQFARFLELEAIQAEVDKVAAALDVMVNGDGNTSTAATSYNLTTLDPNTTANNLTVSAWLAFKAKFANPYQLTHVLGTEAVILQLLLLNVGSGNVQLSQRPDLGGFTPINQTFADGVRWGISADAPASKIVGYDRAWGIGRVVETASEIQEMDRWITNQTLILTATENEGFEVLDPNGLKILNLAA